mmetsp:Transcript_14157/g.37199  ORF Transcript_14157/g.37199 Transcript_14157/m.37199 type:complete len:217 (-) Transcript_14157:566-1216(-)
MCSSACSACRAMYCSSCSLRIFMCSAVRVWVSCANCCACRRAFSISVARLSCASASFPFHRSCSFFRSRAVAVSSLLTASSSEFISLISAFASPTSLFFCSNLVFSVSTCSSSSAIACRCSSFSASRVATLATSSSCFMTKASYLLSHALTSPSACARCLSASSRRSDVAFRMRSLLSRSCVSLRTWFERSAALFSSGPCLLLSSSSSAILLACAC